MRPLAMVIASLAALASPGAGAAVLYKLTDTTGQVTYVDVLPRGFAGTVQRLDIDTSANPMAAPKVPVITRSEPAVMGETDYGAHHPPAARHERRGPAQESRARRPLRAYLLMPPMRPSIRQPPEKSV